MRDWDSRLKSLPFDKVVRIKASEDRPPKPWIYRRLALNNIRAALLHDKETDQYIIVRIK